MKWSITNDKILYYTNNNICSYKFKDNILQKITFLGGAISISAEGNIGIEWNSFRMAWASAKVSKQMIDTEKSKVVINYGCNRSENLEYIYSLNTV